MMKKKQIDEKKKQSDERLEKEDERWKLCFIHNVATQKDY
jgi:hypothetical protein